MTCRYLGYVGISYVLGFTNMICQRRQNSHEKDDTDNECNCWRIMCNKPSQVVTYVSYGVVYLTNSSQQLSSNTTIIACHTITTIIKSLYPDSLDSNFSNPFSSPKTSTATPVFVNPKYHKGNSLKFVLVHFLNVLDRNFVKMEFN